MWYQTIKKIWDYRYYQRPKSSKRILDSIENCWNYSSDLVIPFKLNSKPIINKGRSKRLNLAFYDNLLQHVKMTLSLGLSCFSYLENIYTDKDPYVFTKTSDQRKHKRTEASTTMRLSIPSCLNQPSCRSEGNKIHSCETK